MDRAVRRDGDGRTIATAATAQRRCGMWLVSALLGAVGGLTGSALAGDSPTREQALAAAISDCGRALESGLFKGRGLATIYAQCGMRRSQNGDQDGAIHDLDQAIGLNPQEARFFISRGDAYFKKGDFDRSIEDYGRAIALDPQGDSYRYAFAYGADYVQQAPVNPKYAAFLARGCAYRAKGEFDRAIEDFAQAIKLGPMIPAAFVNRAAAFDRKGEYDRAIEDATQAIKLDPKIAVAYLVRGSAHREKGEYDRATEDFDQAVKFDRATGLNGRCYHRAIVGTLQVALDDCNEALQLLRNSAAVLDSRGFTYLKMGEFDKAIADYDAALRLAPKHANALFGRGMAKRKTGDSAGGDADIAAANAINPKVAEQMARYGVK
jgi:tetratricopeptide (TPR) repeat protein